MQRKFPDHTTFCVGQRLNHNERILVDSVRRPLYSANLQTRYNAKQNVLFGVSHSTTPFVDGNASFQFAQDHLSDFLAAFRHDDDGGVFLDSVDQKVDCLRCCKVGQHRVQRHLNSQEKGGG